MDPEGAPQGSAPRPQLHRLPAPQGAGAGILSDSPEHADGSGGLRRFVLCMVAVALLVALALVKPMGPKVLVSGSFLVLLGLRFLNLLMTWTGTWQALFETDVMLGEVLGVGMVGVRFRGYLFLLVGLLMMKPRGASA